MKTFLLAILVVIGVSQFSQAQELGIRFGDAWGGHYAVDAVFGLGQFCLVDGAVPFGNVGVCVEALWDLLYKPLEKNLYWYVGVGPSAYLGDPFALAVSGEIGLEYRFDFPMVIGADWRPSFIVIEKTDFEAGWFGLNIRYVFGK